MFCSLYIRISHHSACSKRLQFTEHVSRVFCSWLFRRLFLPDRSTLPVFASCALFPRLCFKLVELFVQNVRCLLHTNARILDAVFISPECAICSFARRWLRCLICARDWLLAYSFAESPRSFPPTLLSLFLYQILPANPTHPLALSSRSTLSLLFYRNLSTFYSLIRFASRCRFISSFFSSVFLSHLPYRSLLPLDISILPVSSPHFHSFIQLYYSFSFVYYRTISFTHTIQFPVHAKLACIFHISYSFPFCHLNQSTKGSGAKKVRVEVSKSEGFLFTYISLRNAT